MAVITMGGLEWGGARKLGPLVAERLGADYVDKLVLTDIARQVGATIGALHEREARPPSFGDRFSKVALRVIENIGKGNMDGDPFGPGFDYFVDEYEDLPQPIIGRGHHVEDEPYLNALTSVMQEIAANGNVVIVGRAGNIILKDNPDVLRIGIVAEFSDRIRTAMARESLSEKDAEKALVARGNARHYFFKRFFDVTDPDAAELYHLVLNTSSVGPEYAVNMIVGAAKALDGRRLAKETRVVAHA